MKQAAPVEIVSQQLDAYNARDLERFCACFRDDVRIFRMPQPEPAVIGKAALRAFYAEHRFNRPNLHAQLVNRIETGNKVIDHERVSGLAETPVEMVAVYRVVEGLIATAWFFSPAD
jgi:hypothetical protein